MTTFTKRYSTMLKGLVVVAVAALSTSWVSSSYAGRQGGAASARDTVSAHDTDVFKMAFTKDQQARISVRGDRSTDLDCYVYDSDGDLVAKDDDNTDYCLLSWTPAWTGKFSLQIRNRGSEPNEYVMTTN